MNAKKELSLKDKIYSENLIKYKGKQTKAYQATYPNSSYNSARANGVRKTKKLIARDNGWNLNKITPSYIIEKLDNLALNARKDSDKIACLQLLGKFKALFTDRLEHKDTSLTPQMEQEIQNYIQGNRLAENL